MNTIGQVNIVDVTENNDLAAALYEGKNTTNFGENEYFQLINNGKVENTFVIKNGIPSIIYPRSLNDAYFGKLEPLNKEQVCAFNLLANNSIGVKVLTGSFGSGKTFLMVAHALHLVSSNRFDKIVWVRNNISVKDTGELGYLPGTELEKLMPYCGPLVDHLGGLNGFTNLMSEGKIEVCHLGHLRGRDIRNSIILCSEAENLTKQHVQLLIGRVGENSQLWLEGDLAQTDKKIFEQNNGLRAAVEKLSGNPLFGYVHLPQTERSQIARLADLL